MSAFAGRIFARSADGSIGRAIAGAQLFFSGQVGHASAETAAAGNYRVELPAGRYKVTARAEGFDRATTRAILTRPLQTLNLFLEAADAPQAIGIHGRVFERQLDGTIGDPVADASVAVSRRGFARTTTTDENGAYSFVLPRGNYLLDARAGGFQPARSTAIVNSNGMAVVNLFIRTLAARPGDRHVEVCTRISATEGVEQTGDVLIPGGGIVRMTYRVVDGKAWVDGGIGLGSVASLAAEVEKTRGPSPTTDVTNSGGFSTVSQALVAQGSRDKLWEQALVPFQIDESNAILRRRVEAAMGHIETNSNIVFVPASDRFDDRVVLRFSRDSDASSADLGRIGGEQEVLLNEAFDVGGIVHELMHTLGVFHEQTRNDRDAFVDVSLESIENGRAGNFNKAVFRGGVDIGPYDYNSVMHYSAWAFGRDANCEVEFRGGASTTMRYDLKTYPGVEALAGGWLQITIPMDEFAASSAVNTAVRIRFPGVREDEFSFLLTDIGFTTAAGGEVAAADSIYVSDPATTAGLAPPTTSDAGTSATIDANFTADGQFSPVLEITSGEGAGVGRHAAAVQFEGYPAGFAQGYESLVFKLNLARDLVSDMNAVTIRPLDPAVALSDLGNARGSPPFLSGGDIAGLKELYPAKLDFDGGHLWGGGNYVTGIAMGNIDGTGGDELVVTRRAPENSRYFILDNAARDFAMRIRGGETWGSDNYATCVAMGDVDGDGNDEIIIGRKANTNHRFRVVKVNKLSATNWTETELFSGGESWGGGNYVTDVAIGVDASGTPLIGVARRAPENARFMIFSGAADGFRLLYRGGVDWGGNNYATGIAFGDIDGDGRLEIGIARKADRNGRWLIYKDRRGDYTDFRVIHSGGVDWGGDNYATGIAFGDVDGDGRDEVAVSRKAPENGRFFIFDDFNRRFRLLKSGGERWGSNAYATAVALGDVDGDGRVELAVCRRAGENGRVFLLDDEIENYRPLWDDGRRWGGGNFATCVALGNALGAGRERHIAVGRKADQNHRFSVTNYDP